MLKMGQDRVECLHIFRSRSLASFPSPNPSKPPTRPKERRAFQPTSPQPSFKVPSPTSQLQPPNSNLPAPTSQLQPPSSTLHAPRSTLHAPNSTLHAPRSSNPHRSPGDGLRSCAGRHAWSRACQCPPSRPLFSRPCHKHRDGHDLAAPLQKRDHATRWVPKRPNNTEGLEVFWAGAYATCPAGHTRQGVVAAQRSEHLIPGGVQEGSPG